MGVIGVSEYAIEMLGITKTFPGIIANDNISLRLRKGEVHALLGENGAGKSTLMSVLFGLYEPDSGEIRKNGRRVTVKNPNQATALGIGMVHQHFRLVDAFTVFDNIILGSESTRFGFMKKRQALERVLRLSEKYSLEIDPFKKVEDISVGMQQRTEILKMLYRDNEILIFDEPTAVLTPAEIKQLLKTMKTFKNEGKSILFITHKLDEIMECADRVTVLRKGKCVGTTEVKSTDKRKLSEMMMGRSASLSLEKSKAEPQEEILRLEKLCVASRLNKGKLAAEDISFTLHGGEILAVAGVDGNGQRELVEAITGLCSVKSGKIFLCGRDATRLSLRQKSRIYLSHIPEDRHKHGLVTSFPLKDNLILQRYKEPYFQRYGFIKKGNVAAYAEGLIGDYDIRLAEGVDTLTAAMSGGNQQKAVIARELDRKMPLVIAVQPTRGLDIGAIEYIHSRLLKERDEGRAVLLVSLELDEVMELADRIIVLHKGRITGRFAADEVSPQKLGLAMAGVKREGKDNE